MHGDRGRRRLFQDDQARPEATRRSMVATSEVVPAANGDRRRSAGRRQAMTTVDEDVACSCYGCEIQRQRAGITAPDRSGEPRNPIGACDREILGFMYAHLSWGVREFAAHFGVSCE